MVDRRITFFFFGIYDTIVELEVNPNMRNNTNDLVTYCYYLIQ